MNKKEFLANFRDDDRVLAANLFEKIEFTKKTSLSSYSGDFLKPSIWKKLERISNKLGIKVFSFGIYQDSERRLSGFCDIFEEIYSYSYPLVSLEMDYKNKFKDLTHRQFMGILTSSGIKREKYGDIIKKDNKFYVPCLSDVSEYIINYMSGVKENFEIKELIIDEENIPEFDFEDMLVVLSSMRLDSVVSKIAGVSRSAAEDLIKEGKVLLDYEAVNEKSLIVDIEQILTIRSKGKFKISAFDTKTKKGNLKVLVKKFK